MAKVTGNVTVFKRCGCRDPETKKALGSKCPQLRRGDGVWNYRHGKWGGKAIACHDRDGSPVPLWASGFDSREDVEDWFRAVFRLLTIPDQGPAGHAGRLKILAIAKQALKDGAPLPAYDDLRRRHDFGADFEPGTVGEFLRTWLAARETSGKLKASTIDGYRDHIERVWLPHLGDLPLDRLAPPHIYRVFEAIDEENARILECRASDDPAVRKSVAGRKPCGPVTKQRIRATLRSALKSAYPRLVSYNAASGDAVELASGESASLTEWTRSREKAWRAGYEARLAALPVAPGKKQAKREDRFRCWQDAARRPSTSMVWRIDHITTFLDAVEGTWLYPMWYLFIYRGLRRGEACGIWWEDADLAEGLVHVERTWIEIGHKPVADTPKSEASEAPVSLDEAAVAVLTDWQIRQREQAAQWGDAWTDSGHVFTAEDGKPWNPGYVTWAFEHTAFDLGLPPVALRDLRHAAACLAHRAGAKLENIQALLRHKSYAVTVKYYLKIFEDHDRELAEQMSRVLPTRAAIARAAAKETGQTA